LFKNEIKVIHLNQEVDVDVLKCLENFGALGEIFKLEKIISRQLRLRFCFLRRGLHALEAASHSIEQFVLWCQSYIFCGRDDIERWYSILSHQLRQLCPNQ